MCCLWWTVWLRDAVRKSNPQKMTLARQRVLSSSEVRASDLEHGGSWVRIPSGAQIFSVSSYGWFFTSPFISFINPFRLSKLLSSLRCHIIITTVRSSTGQLEQSFRSKLQGLQYYFFENFEIFFWFLLYYNFVSESFNSLYIEKTCLV